MFGLMIGRTNAVFLLLYWLTSTLMALSFFLISVSMRSQSGSDYVRLEQQKRFILYKDDAKGYLDGYAAGLKLKG